MSDEGLNEDRLEDAKTDQVERALPDSLLRLRPLSFGDSFPTLEEIGREAREKASQFKEKVNKPSADGLSPLHWACIKDRADWAEWLLDNGANPTSPHPRTGLQPLHFVKSEEVRRVLHRHGADHAGIDTSMTHNNEVVRNVVAANEQRHLLSVEDYLKLYGVHPLFGDKFGTTPMHLARSGPFLKLLIRYGGDVNVPDRIGDTPLHTIWREFFQTHDRSSAREACVQWIATLKSHGATDSENKGGMLPEDYGKQMAEFDGQTRERRKAEQENWEEIWQRLSQQSRGLRRGPDGISLIPDD